MKKTHCFLMLLLSCFLLLVSCSHPEDPGNPVDNDRPEIHNYEEFLSSVQGCWKKLDDFSDTYLWITEDTITKCNVYQFKNDKEFYSKKILNVISNGYADGYADGYYIVNSESDFSYEYVFGVDSYKPLGFLLNDGDKIYFRQTEPYKDGFRYNIDGYWYVKVSDKPAYLPRETISSVREFESFTRGFWQNVDNKDEFFWVTPDSIIIPDSQQSGTGSSFSHFSLNNCSYKVTTKTYTDFVDNFTLDSSVKFDYETVFSGDSSITVKSTGKSVLQFFPLLEDGIPYKEYEDGYCYYIGIYDGDTINPGWYYKADDYTHNTKTVKDMEGTYSYSDSMYERNDGTIVIKDGKWQYYGNNNPVFTSGTVSLETNNLVLAWDDNGWRREETFILTTDNTGIWWKLYNNYYSTLFSSFFNTYDTYLLFTYSAETDFDPSLYGSAGDITNYIGTYEFNTASAPQVDGSITISDGNWSFEGKPGSSAAITPVSASMDGSNVKLTYTMPGVQQDQEEVFTVTIDGSDATWHCVMSGGYPATLSAIFSSLFGVIDTDMTFSYSE